MKHALTAKQTNFFLRHRAALQATEAAMRGALQLIVEERGLSGRVTLSEDCSELIEIEPSDSLPGPVNGVAKELQT